MKLFQPLRQGRRFPSSGRLADRDAGKCFGAGDAGEPGGFAARCRRGLGCPFGAVPSDGQGPTSFAAVAGGKAGGGAGAGDIFKGRGAGEFGKGGEREAGARVAGGNRPGGVRSFIVKAAGRSADRRAGARDGIQVAFFVFRFFFGRFDGDGAPAGPVPALGERAGWFAGELFVADRHAGVGGGAGDRREDGGRDRRCRLNRPARRGVEALDEGVVFAFFGVVAGRGAFG